MKPISLSSPEKPLVCRPDKSLWFLVAILAATGILSLFAPHSQPGSHDNLIFCALFVVPSLFVALYLRWCRIVADARGVTFHGFHPRRFVTWSEIEDYELRIPSSSQSKSGLPVAYLKIGAKWRALSRTYTPYDALLERIARDASWSRSRVWQQNHLRDDGDWPKNFEYRDTSGWKLAGMYFGLSLLLLSQLFTNAITSGIAPILANIALIWSELSFWGRVGFVAMPVMMSGSLPLIILAQYPAIVRRRVYLGQKIVATRAGIALYRDVRKTFIAWDEIESYHLETLLGNFQPDLAVVEAPGKRIEFVTGISNTKTLLALIQNRAKNASTTKWLHQHGVDEDVLGGAASFYRGGNVGVGPKIHHYRTRMTRIFLLFGLTMSVAFPFQIHQQMISGRLGNGQPAGTADNLTGMFFFALIAVATLLGLAAFLFSSVRCEDDGLRHKSLWRERFLRWDEIEKLVFNGYYSVVSGQKSKIRFGMVADYQGLCAEIEKRSGVECKHDGNAV